MRANPNVCFQVDTVQNMANWRSVIASGTFRELEGEEAVEARDYLFNHLWPFLTSTTTHPHEHASSLSSVDDSNRIKPVMFKIVIDKKTGRFEKH